MSEIWSKEEDEIIREKYPSATWEALLSLLDKRNQHTIYTRARLLGVKRDEEIWKPHHQFNLNKETLVQLYYRENLSLEEIGKIFGCNNATVGNYMERYGMKRRKSGGVYSTKSKLKNLTEGQKGYLAGILDGEGTISIKDGRAIVSIGNTDKPLMLFLSSLFEMKFFHKRGSTSNCKQMYGISINSFIGVYQFLTTILPYLIIKRKKALDAINLCVTEMNKLDDVLYQKLKGAIGDGL